MQNKISVSGPGKDNRESRFGRKSLKAIMTINPKYGRLYFSAMAVTVLDLQKHFFRIERTAYGWRLLLSSSKNDLSLKVHQGAYYIVGKKLVNNLVSEFNGRHLLLEGIELKRKSYPIVKADKLEFELSKKAIDILDRKKNISLPVKGRRKANPFETDQDGALKLLAAYQETDFDGRIKTHDIILAERVFQNKSHSI